LNEHGDKVSAADKSALETALAAAKEATKGDDAEKIKSTTQDLMQASMKLGEAIYSSNKQAAEGGEPGAQDGAQSGQGGSDNVVDAQFEEVKDDKKKSA
jgi:molecular chaperone DnaK